MVSKNSHRKYFNGKAHVWDTPEDKEKIKKLIKIFQELSLHPHGYVLDIGCGTGILIPLFSEEQNKKLHLVELDFSENMLRQNQDKWGQCATVSLSHVLADTHDLPFRNETFQWIIGFAVLPHLSEKMKVLAEWSKILASEGNLIILHLMGSRQLNCFHSQVNGIIAHDRLQPAAELSRIIQQQGFEVATAIDQDDLYLIHAIKK